jgi:ABC-type phosphate/phosphonate transport system ATPase subunit
MQVDEFPRFMAGIKGLHGPKASAAIGEAAERLDLARVMRLTTGKLSRGFCQRVSIAQPLCGPVTFRICKANPASSLPRLKLARGQISFQFQSAFGHLDLLD